MSKLFNIVNFIFIRNKAWLMWVTISANSNIGALDAIIMSSSSIDWASFISHIVFVHIFKSINRFSSMASLIFHFTWNQNLWSNINIWPSSFSHDFNSIRKSWCRCVCPTWSTIWWKML